MVDVTQKQGNRLRFLNALYEAVDGRRNCYVAFIELGQNLGLDGGETVDILQYLLGEHLIDTTSGSVALSHWGIKEVEQARTRPEEPTEHFPPAINIITVHSMVGSVIQQGSEKGSVQSNGQSVDLPALSSFVKEVMDAAPKLELPEPRLQELRSDLQVIQSQLVSPKPKMAMIREGLASVRNIIEGATGSAVATAIITKFPQIASLFGV